MATLLKVLSNLADIKSAGGVALGLGTQGPRPAPVGGTDALNQTARVMERAQKQQCEMMSILGKQAAAMEALADLVAKVRNDDVERHNQHATASLDAVEKEAFGPNYNQLPSTPPLN